MALNFASFFFILWGFHFMWAVPGLAAHTRLKHRVHVLWGQNVVPPCRTAASANTEMSLLQRSLWVAVLTPHKRESPAVVHGWGET